MAERIISQVCPKCGTLVWPDSLPGTDFGLVSIDAGEGKSRLGVSFGDRQSCGCTEDRRSERRSARTIKRVA